MNWQDRITVDPDIVFGKPRIKGTRLSVEFLLGLFANGWTEQQVLDSYPNLAREDLQALFGLAAEMITETGFVINSKFAA